MKRLAALVSVLAIIGILAILLRSGHSPEQQGSAPIACQSLNQPSHPVSSAEETGFLKLVCDQASGAGGGYAHQCASLPGYPSSDYGGAGLGLGITLKSVVYGHLTSATADEAYITYAGSFEPHASNYGGGILFTKTSDGWVLNSWHPGGQADHCVLLTPSGRAHFVCLTGWEGQGEADSDLALTTLPPPQGSHPTLLSARDLRGTMDPNANCKGRTSGQALLLSIDTLSPATGGAAARITYVSPTAAQAACATNQLANAPTSSATLSLQWEGGEIKTTPDMNFAAFQ